MPPGQDSLTSLAEDKLLTNRRQRCESSQIKEIAEYFLPEDLIRTETHYRVYTALEREKRGESS